MKKLPLMLTWKALKELIGHPYCRTHTERLMQPSYEVERRTKDEGLVVDVIRNADPFPSAVKLGDHNNSRLVWPTKLVVEWYRRRGLPLPEGVDDSL